MCAKLSYKWSGYRRLFKYSSPLIRIFESGKIRRYAKRDSAHSPVFILGLPRSGSTILYQLLTDMFDVLYFDNLMMLGRENLYFSSWLSQKLFRNKLHNSYHSNYGNTEDSGLHAPAEAGQFWYQWISRESVEVNKESLSGKSQEELKSVLMSVINRYEKPFIVKNLYSVLRINLLKELYPNARFIYLKRDPLAVAQSIYLGRKKNLKDIEAEWWSVPVPGYQDLLSKPVEVQIARQVHTLDQIICDELKKIEPSRVMEVNYEELSIETIFLRFEGFLNTGIKKNFNPDSAELKVINTQKVEDEVYERLKFELDKLSSN